MPTTSPKYPHNIAVTKDCFKKLKSIKKQCKKTDIDVTYTEIITALIDYYENNKFNNNSIHNDNQTN